MRVTLLYLSNNVSVQPFMALLPQVDVNHQITVGMVRINQWFPQYGRLIAGGFNPTTHEEEPAFRPDLVVMLASPKDFYTVEPWYKFWSQSKIDRARTSEVILIMSAIYDQLIFLKSGVNVQPPLLILDERYSSELAAEFSAVGENCIHWLQDPRLITKLREIKNFTNQSA